jgi:hypothetical protein
MEMRIAGARRRALGVNLRDAKEDGNFCTGVADVSFGLSGMRELTLAGVPHSLEEL